LETTDIVHRMTVGVGGLCSVQVFEIVALGAFTIAFTFKVSVRDCSDLLLPILFALYAQQHYSLSILAAAMATMSEDKAQNGSCCCKIPFGPFSPHYAGGGEKE
jgi:hypothetical protein